MEDYWNIFLNYVKVYKGNRVHRAISQSCTLCSHSTIGSTNPRSPTHAGRGLLAKSSFVVGTTCSSDWRHTQHNVVTTQIETELSSLIYISSSTALMSNRYVQLFIHTQKSTQDVTDRRSLINVSEYLRWLLNPSVTNKRARSRHFCWVLPVMTTFVDPPSRHAV